MKRSTFFACTLIFITTIITCSCSNLPNDETIKKLIKEKLENDNLGKLNLLTPCNGTTFFEIPKSFNYDTTLDSKNILDNDRKKQFEILSQLKLNGLVTLTKKSESFSLNQYKQNTHFQQYEIGLTKKGEKYLYESPGNNYVFNLFDLNSFELIEKKKMPNDNVSVKYKLDYTPVFQFLKNFCDNNNHSFEPKESMIAYFLYADKKWKLLTISSN